MTTEPYKLSSEFPLVAQGGDGFTFAYLGPDKIVLKVTADDRREAERIGHDVGAFIKGHSPETTGRMQEHIAQANENKRGLVFTLSN